MCDAINGLMASKWKELCRLCVLNLLASARASWSLVAEDGPSPRSVHAGAWGSQSFWIHGGAGVDCLQDLWTFDSASNSWTLFAFDTGPSERKDHVVIWDGQALWIHGGYDGNNFMKDLWKFSNGWTEIAGNSVAGPSARSEHVAVWDATHSDLWIHGGYDGSLKSDLWKFDSTEKWQFVAIQSLTPSARAQHVATWDDVQLSIWLHGGYDDQGSLFSSKIERKTRPM